MIAARVSRQGGFKVEWSVSPDAEGLHDRLVLSLVRESLLVNVAKHADAQRAWVTVSRGDDAVLVEVLDDGRGYPAGRLEERGAVRGTSGWPRRSRRRGPSAGWSS